MISSHTFMKSRTPFKLVSDIISTCGRRSVFSEILLYYKNTPIILYKHNEVVIVLVYVRLTNLENIIMVEVSAAHRQLHP